MSWKHKGTFRIARWFVAHISKPMKTIWSTEFDGAPSVFVGNHDSSYGPMAMCAHFELYEDLVPWIEARTLTPRDMPSYVRQDFWWPRDRWYTKILDYTVTYLAALLLPLILWGSANIPVRRDAGVVAMFRKSVGALCFGKHILIFPEQPIDYRQYAKEINSGFVALGRLYTRKAGKPLNFYPVYIDWKGKEIRVGEPVTYEPEGDFAELTKKVADAVEEHIENKGFSKGRIAAGKPNT